MVSMRPGREPDAIFVNGRELGGLERRRVVGVDVEEGRVIHLEG